MRKITSSFLPVFCLVLAFLAVSGFALTPSSLAQSQEDQQEPVGQAQDLVVPPPPSEPGTDRSGVLDATQLFRETLHLNTIGTYSAGFVLLSYGYIGVLADALGEQVYTPDMVTSMLKETITYLNNANNQLKNYKNLQNELSDADLRFLSGISTIIGELISEAEALADFASGNEEALENYNKARKRAWQSIKNILDVQ
jgi:hypothetical protein